MWQHLDILDRFLGTHAPHERVFNHGVDQRVQFYNVHENSRENAPKTDNKSKWEKARCMCAFMYKSTCACALVCMFEAYFMWVLSYWFQYATCVCVCVCVCLCLFLMCVCGCMCVRVCIALALLMLVRYIPVLNVWMRSVILFSGSLIFSNGHNQMLKVMLDVYVWKSKYQMLHVMID